MSAWISLREGRRLLGVAARTAIPVSKGRMSRPALSVVFWLLLALSAVFGLTLLLLPIPDFGDIEGPMIPSLPLFLSLSLSLCFHWRVCRQVSDPDDKRKNELDETTREKEERLFPLLSLYRSMALDSRCAQVMTILASGLLKSEVHCRKISPGCRAIDVWSFKSQQFITQNLSRGLRDQNVSPIEHKEVDVVYEGGATFVITDGCLSATRRRRSTIGRKNRVGGLFNVPCDTFSASSWLFNLHARD